MQESVADSLQTHAGNHGNDPGATYNIGADGVNLWDEAGEPEQAHRCLTFELNDCWLMADLH